MNAGERPLTLPEAPPTQLESVHANAQKAIAPAVPADQDAEVTFMIVRGSAEDGPYRCPCCGFITLTERAAFEICDVCYWEDDGQDERDADEVRGGPHHDLSLRQARRNFEVLGACNEYCAQFVRDARPSGGAAGPGGRARHAYAWPETRATSSRAQRGDWPRSDSRASRLLGTR
ncbi:CPCC family cysteine-rich protein [Streptomyces sp. SD15]